MSLDADQLKMAAAESAVKQVKDGMVVGLGSGSTAKLAVDAIGKRVREGLRIVGIPTSENTAAQARALGIPLVTLADEPRIDLTIDGADEVQEGSLDLIKGRGGALLREKIVASASRRLVIMVHDTKIVSHLAEHDPVPVEIVPFGWQATERKLVALGAKPELRKNPGGEPFLSDGGHYIFDCGFEPLTTAGELANQLDHVVGVVEHGLFIGMTSEVHVAGAGGVHILKGGSE
ncbi:MAG TPA: ribose-5-phosphate isomerase RpiA [Bryobacteraceae bacterium]|nr:ribose-5-phosphate isomerase RpiA [Bryobacteraceae bacterium]